MSNDFENKVNDIKIATRTGNAAGVSAAFEVERAHKNASKRAQKLVTKATMIAAGVEPPSGQWETVEAAEKWLMATAREHFASVANAAE